MTHKRLNLISDLYFYLILLSGVLYTALLIIASSKIFPAFSMQIIFLLDALKFNHNIISLTTSRLFLLNVIPGLFLAGLIFQFVKNLIKSGKNLNVTRKIVGQLTIVKSTPEFFKFKSDASLIFTLGFLKPKVFISSALFKTHRRQEIAAMIQHEINHKINLHPLKIFIAGFVKSILPAIPGKNWLIDNYLTLVEVSSDQFSEAKINNKSPLVSALLKFKNQNFELGISYFNSQSERIKILVGQRKQLINIPLAYYSLVLVVLLSGTLFIKNSTIFFDCRHILDCVRTLANPHSQSLTTSVHCQ